jgi:hypothetical protein
MAARVVEAAELLALLHQAALVTRQVLHLLKEIMAALAPLMAHQVAAVALLLLVEAVLVPR